MLSGDHTSSPIAQSSLANYKKSLAPESMLKIEQEREFYENVL